VRSSQYDIEQDFYIILSGPWVDFTYIIGSFLTLLGKIDDKSYSIVLKRNTGVKKVLKNGEWVVEELKKFSDVNLLIIDPETRIKVTDLTGER
jgi:DNA replication factor Dna2